MIQGSSPAIAAATVNPVACPYLGLADDPRTHFAFATTAHRCHSGSRPEGIEVSHQAARCLSADYLGCSRYVVPTGAAPRPGVLAGQTEGPITNVSGRVQWRGRADGQPTLVVRSAVILAGALTLAIAAAVLLGQGRFLPAGPAGISGSSPTARLTTPAASVAGPTATLQPSTASGPPPSGPTASPTGSVRALPQTHIVARGETLTSIARHYGVTLAALEKANGLKDPSLIVTGQRLIIPAP